VTALIKYDAARKAIAAAHRVDEAKKIRDRAEAVRTYAKLAGDLDMQNMAAEIRIRAERRAGQLLLEMEKNPGTRGALHAPGYGSVSALRYAEPDNSVCGFSLPQALGRCTS